MGDTGRDNARRRQEDAQRDRDAEVQRQQNPRSGWGGAPPPKIPRRPTPGRRRDGWLGRLVGRRRR